MREKRVYTFSKIITYFEYNLEKQMLTIAFNDGVVIDFIHFPEAFYQEFEKSESHGKFYLKYIKDRFEQNVRYED